MTRFDDYALQYILSDEKDRMRSAVSNAAKEIRDSNANPLVVSQWAVSVQPWIQTSGDSDDVDNTEDVLSRSKALDFLADTLELLDDGLLGPAPVKMLIGFFGAIFGVDHKAGITPSARALRQLIRMKAFDSAQAVDIIQHVVKLQDEFRLQSPHTRLEVYRLLQGLVKDTDTQNKLKDDSNGSCKFILDVLSMCRNERDPQNLIIWFGILKCFLQEFFPPASVCEAIFKTFSLYFPISMRDPTKAAAVHIQDLKSALLDCFKADAGVAPYALPFLVQKLDQGDTMSVALKIQLDILHTMNECLKSYKNSDQSIAPFIDKLWHSLRFEVRNGEIEEAIEAVLPVFGTLASRLERDSLHKFIKLCLQDCTDDLTTPTYTLQAGQILYSVYSANYETYSIVAQVLFKELGIRFKQSASADHKEKLLTILNRVIDTRTQMLAVPCCSKSNVSSQGEDPIGLALSSCLESIYLPIWDNLTTQDKLDSSQTSIFRLLIAGMAALVEQERQPQGTDPQGLVLSEVQCSKVASMLSQILLGKAVRNYSVEQRDAIEHATVLSFRRIASAYPPGFISLVAMAKSKLAAANDPKEFKVLTARLSFICCPERLRNKNDMSIMACLLIAYLDEIETALSEPRPQWISAMLVAAIHLATLNFRETVHADQSNQEEKLPSSWAEDIKSDYSCLPQQDARLGCDWKITAIISASQSLNTTDFSRISLLITRQLYRRATTITADNDRPIACSPDTAENLEFFKHLAALATTVVGMLTADQQRAASLASESICLFRGSSMLSKTAIDSVLRCSELARASIWKSPELLYLSSGIIKGLWPSAIADMKEPLMTPAAFQSLIHFNAAENHHIVSSVICSIANKYPRNTTSWNELADTITAELGSLNSNALHPMRLIFAFAAGALPNYDKSTLKLVQALVKVLQDPTYGALASREFSGLLTPGSEFDPEQHAIVKPLWKQWTYIQIIKPMLLETPARSQTVPCSTYYPIAILGVLEHIPSTIYQSDGEAIARIALQVLSKISISPDTEAALNIILDFVVNDPAILEQMLESVIEVCRQIQNNAVGERMDMRKDDTTGLMVRTNPPMCRKLALVLLATLPLRYKEQHIVPHARKLKKFLWEACWDPIREVRLAARKARASWADVD